MSAVRAWTRRVQGANDLDVLVGLIRGRACDLHLVALDDQSGRLHIPILRSRGSKRSPGRSVEGELTVRSVVEFSLAGSTSVRWFNLDGLSYQQRTHQLAISSDRALQFLLTVERLDVAVRSIEKRPVHPPAPECWERTRGPASATRRPRPRR